MDDGDASSSRACCVSADEDISVDVKRREGVAELLSTNGAEAMAEEEDAAFFSLSFSFTLPST